MSGLLQQDLKMDTIIDTIALSLSLSVLTTSFLFVAADRVATLQRWQHASTLREDASVNVPSQSRLRVFDFESGRDVSLSVRPTDRQQSK
jgi:hypothetical protein